MTRFFQAFATVVLLTAAPGPAFGQESGNEAAQEPITVKRVEPNRVFEPGRAEQVFERYAECIVSREGRLGGSLKKYLRVPLDATAPPEVVEKLVESECVGRGAGQMWMSRDLYRNTLYAALYRREFRRDEPAEFVPATGYDGEFDAQYLPLSERQITLRQVGDCAASHALSSAHRFTIAKVRSDEEAALLPDVVQALSECLDRDEEVAFTRPVLKGMLAESLYKYRRGLTQVEMASAE